MIMTKSKRVISLILVFVMIFSIIPVFPAFAEEITGYEDDEKGIRDVYLHAQGVNPQTTPNISTVYLGDEFNVYFAVDDPNKGDYDADSETHLEPMYDLNGYTVKIYYDPAFLELTESGITSIDAPIDYTVPDTRIETSDKKDDENIGDDSAVDVPTSVGYYVYSLGAGEEKVDGKKYNTAYATIFFSGEYVPQRENGQIWYNLCAIPLKPRKTGNTEVFLEIGSDDEHTLELFAKNVNDDYPPYFEFTAVNGGYHYITIKDKLKPSPPVATPVAGSYTEHQNVVLDAEEGCDIYYSLDGGNTYILYTGEIPVERSTVIYAYAERLSDGKLSNVVEFEYKILPKAPYLFDDKEKLIPNVYTEDDVYEVLVSDKEDFENIADDSEVYYTFSNIGIDELDPENATSDGDPETEWVKIEKQAPSILIDSQRTVRLVTVKNSALGSEYSDIAWYYLGIKPAPVTAEPESGIYDSIQHIELETETENAKIYYTTDGSDPRTNGILYTIPLTLNKDTTVRAAAYYDGQWSDLSSFWYVFQIVDDYGVDAFYPSGVYEGSVNVTLTPNTPENSIIYSTDGGETWQDYEDTIVLEEDTEILAKAVDVNGNEGGEYKFTYTIKPLPPEFAPESTQFTNADSISIHCIERTNSNFDRYELYYTLDGSDPVTSRTRILADEISDSAIISINKYTVVTAAVLRDGTTWSDVVQHSYDIVISKPVKPLTTLIPGYYTREIGSDPFVTQFAPVPTGTKIYYTIAYGNEVKPDPIPGEDGTFEYTPGDEIEIKGKTLIKAVAVNSFGAKSDIGIFEYTITPEAPVAAPSAIIGSDKLPVVPVETVEGSTVYYTVEDFENYIKNAPEKFYIDMSTGDAYKDEACTKPIGEYASGKTYSESAILEISAELDKIESEKNVYYYGADGNEETLATPYADKKNGVYEEINADGNNNFLVVHLDSLNDGDTIQYMEDNSGIWVDYDGEGIALNKDTVLQIRSVKGDVTSPVASYVYEFIPLMPIITLPSGRYSEDSEPSTFIVYDDRIPDDADYNIFYRPNGEKLDVLYRGDERFITHTMFFKAYVINEKTGKKSKNAIAYYIIEQVNTAEGNVYTAYPYEVNPGDTKYIASHMLDDADYNEGIKLYTNNQNANIKYFYEYTKVDGTKAASEVYVYDNATPIFVNASMKDISITAWLIDKEGNQIEDTESKFNYVFVDLLVPETSLYKDDPDKTEYKKNTKYTIVDEYDDDVTEIYYTLDGSDPSDDTNEERKLYDGSELKITGTTTVKAVYYRACGRCGECKDDNHLHCINAVYSEVGAYRYTVPKTPIVVTGGGGGTVTVDNTRKYTKDIFGNEHPTHIGYIKGYPDGSVQADGNITREEVAVILYRVMNHEYEEPFTSTGEVFPDVELSRWSVTEIEYLTNKGVINGYPNGEFQPADMLTRAEFAALIYRFVPEEYKNKPAENTFTDLTEEHWAYDEILGICGSKLMQGYEDSSFQPQDYITRAEVMTVMNKILGRKPDDTYVKSLKFNPFNDLLEEKWYYVTVLEATVTHNYYLNKAETLEEKWEDWK